MADYASLNGDRVISGGVTIPAYGCWYADLVLSSGAVLVDPLVVVLGNLTLRGAKVRSASYGGSRSVRLVGGAGGWRKAVAPKPYRSPAGVQASIVLGDVAREVGETLSFETDRVLGEFWARGAGPASDLLELIAGPRGWFVRPDGVTRIGARSSPLIASPFTVTEVHGAQGKIVVGTEDLAAWQPGARFVPPILGTEQTISGVWHAIDESGKFRTEVLTSP